MVEYQKIANAQWDYKLFDCMKNPPMCIWSCWVPFGTDCMSAVTAKVTDPENKNAWIEACLCSLCFCCVGAVFNRYRLAKKLGIEDNLLVNILTACFCTCCSATQEWMQAMKSIKGKHEITIWEYLQEENKNKAQVLNQS